MADFVFSGGCRWNDLCAVDVKVGADGTPISCKNPITGAEISGGGGMFGDAVVQFVNDQSTVYFSNPPALWVEDNSMWWLMDEFEAAQYDPQHMVLVNGSFTIITDLADSYSVTGNATYDSETGYIVVTGDCTITLVSAGN